MTEKVFISGSISMKSLPTAVKQRLDNIIRKNLHVLVGDAAGVDKLVQDYCQHKNYTNVTIFSVYSTPRYRVPNFRVQTVDVSADIKSERERQEYKDRAMTHAAQYCLIIWNGSSKGSYQNIKRALAEQKKIVVYHSQQNTFLADSDLNDIEIDFIFRTNTGYSASEVVAHLLEEGYDYFKKTRDLNKHLIDQDVIRKEDDVYLPCSNYEQYFFVTKHRGKITGIRFKVEFINWIEDWIRENRKPEVIDMFRE